MTLTQIQIIDTLVRHGSLALASQVLHKTQPALSMAVKKLEDELGIALFDRAGYRLELTEAGKAFYSHCLPLLQQYSHLKSFAKHLKHGNEVTLRVAYDITSPIARFMPLLKSFKEQFSHTQLHLSSVSRLMALHMLTNNEVDIAISPFLPGLLDNEAFDSFPIDQFAIVVVASPEFLKQHGFANQHRFSKTELASLPEISAQNLAMNIDVRKFKQMHSPWQIKVDGTHAAKDALLAGMGWATLPKNLIDAELQDGRLLHLQSDDFDNSYLGEIRIAKRRDIALGPAGNALWQALYSLLTGIQKE